MCGRFTLTSDTEELAKELEAIIDPGFDWKPRYNLAPSQMIPVVVLDREGKRHLTLKKWGLIPSWSKDPSIGSRMINARVESAAEKPAFKRAFLNHRCVIPADGFYEWKGEGKEKRPLRILAKSGELFVFAGLWEEWKSPSGEVIETFTILTTEAQGPIRSIHSRVPVILAKG
jgi:putative SOS response-associated peptidase YedK